MSLFRIVFDTLLRHLFKKNVGSFTIASKFFRTQTMFVLFCFYTRLA